MPADFSRITLRPAVPADQPFCFAVYASTRAEELAATGWPGAQREAFLREQFATRTSAYRTSFPGADHSLVLQGRTEIGVLIVHRTSDEIRVVDVALLPKKRGAGIGTWLLRQLMGEAGDTGRPLRLQVLKDNPALKLYLRLGFSPAGENGQYRKLEWIAAVANTRRETLS